MVTEGGRGLRPPLRILYLEDNETDAELVSSLLQDGGLDCEVTRVETADDFVAVLKRGGIDLIFSDLSLPSFDGLSALALARERRSDVPFIFVSGTLGEEGAIDALRLGATDYVLKERMARLMPAVRRALEEQAQRQARQRAEEELQAQRAALYQSEKLAAMASLVAGVTHELNNPLSVVMGQANLLRRASGEGPLAERAEKIVLAAERCARIVRKFLALARQQPRQRQRVSLNQVVRETLEIMAYPLRVDTVEVVLSLATHLPPLRADPHELQHVLINLITNAQQAMRQKAPPRTLTIATAFDRSADRVLLRVADNGPGIAPELEARIFEPFFTTKPPGEGTGLGLSLCQGIAADHGGTVRLETRPGHGATFVVELPLQSGPTATTGPRTEGAELRRGLSILVVDDDPAVREILAELLAADEHRVETAPDGSVALEMIRRGSYDLIMSDLKMPGMDGLALYREVERTHPALARRFVFVTGDTLGPATREVLEETGAPFLTKPFGLGDVQRVVQRALEPSG